MPRVKRFLGVAVARWRLLLFFLLARAREPGTIRQAAVASFALIGVNLAPDRAEAIGWIGLAVAVAVGILTEERPRPAPPGTDEEEGGAA